MRLLLRTFAPSTTFYIIPNESSFNADSYHLFENAIISAHNIFGGSRQCYLNLTSSVVIFSSLELLYLVLECLCGTKSYRRLESF